ncbi:class I SAM-dependent methyltransferase [Paludisphaera mucosa]|uniref:Class I SAM-dependent methyltransferase n=1 Tax=Paludisphaera mucosa TaxID=3030827 RepID=A0ABT6FIB1_9BACT|nr:class I SAM-dependent methyltransferase [Paludisphaera mucosa]MDG3007284.1 class I SAM-dependent methyltransferase [Paludisphaera mucosa]
MGYYAILKSAFRSVLPERVRRLTFDRRSKVYSLVAPIKYFLQKHASHDDVYDRAYYTETVEPLARRSMPHIAATIRDVFGPAKVVDVGCGTGQLLAELKPLGIDAVGYEYSKVAIEMAREKGATVHALDLEQPLEDLALTRADVVVSTEVAEHLPESWADTYVEYLCRTADHVLITAATPGQGGTDHVNEQPNSYWIAKFAARGFHYAEELTLKVRAEWKAAQIADFYSNNVLIFRKPGPAS